MMTPLGSFQLLVTLAAIISVQGLFFARPSSQRRFPTQLYSTESAQDSKFQINRRDILSTGSGLLLAAGVAGLKWQQQQQSDTRDIALLANAGKLSNRRLLSSLDDALDLIDTQCDRRFLHAVVASNYRLLYRGTNASPVARFPSVYALNSFTGGTTTKALVVADFQAALEEQGINIEKNLLTSWDNTSPFHMAATNARDIGSSSSSTASVWPLGDNVHFAWTAQEQATLKSSENLIVDGIDCGVMSLEDALDRPNGRVLFHANSVLLVPTFMEQELVERLKTSFII